jgi:hypothetical protein
MRIGQPFELHDCPLSRVSRRVIWTTRSLLGQQSVYWLMLGVCLLHDGRLRTLLVCAQVKTFVLQSGEFPDSSYPARFNDLSIDLIAVAHAVAQKSHIPSKETENEALMIHGFVEKTFGYL